MKALPYDGGLSLRELLLWLGIAVTVASIYLMATAQPPQDTTRSTTPEAWTPATSPEGEPVLTEVEP